jgi:hypothetical protein
MHVVAKGDVRKLLARERPREHERRRARMQLLEECTEPLVILFSRFPIHARCTLTVLVRTLNTFQIRLLCLEAEGIMSLCSSSSTVSKGSSAARTRRFSKYWRAASSHRGNSSCTAWERRRLGGQKADLGWPIRHAFLPTRRSRPFDRLMAGDRAPDYCGSLVARTLPNRALIPASNRIANQVGYLGSVSYFKGIA